MANNSDKQGRALLTDSCMVKKGFTASKLAGELGVTPQTVNNWRNGTMPNDQIIYELTDLLDLTIEEIREGRPQTLNSGAEERINKRIKSLSFTTGATICIVVGVMMAFVSLYVTCSISMLFGGELDHSFGYYAWAMVSAVSTFGGAYLAISGLKSAK